jgi:hypothetical protein
VGAARARADAAEWRRQSLEVDLVAQTELGGRSSTSCRNCACTYFTSQTADVPSGHFVFVRQGTYGALSLVIVGGRAAGGPPEDEFTILIRGC